MRDGIGALGPAPPLRSKPCARQLDLDYGGIDFGLDPAGNVVFEANATMALDSRRRRARTPTAAPPSNASSKLFARCCASELKPKEKSGGLATAALVCAPSFALLEVDADPGESAGFVSVAREVDLVRWWCCP